jgi:hypothetical protein
MQNLFVLKVTWKGTLRRLFICLRPPSPLRFLSWGGQAILLVLNNEAEGFGWPNTAARLAAWTRVSRQGVILSVKDGPGRLPRQTTQLDPVWGLSVTKCTQNTVMSYVTQGRHGLVL